MMQKQWHIRMLNGKHYSVSCFQKTMNQDEYIFGKLAESLGYDRDQIEKKWIEEVYDTPQVMDYIQ